MERVKVIFQGQVQAVGFRAYCKSFAIQYNLTGSVKNLDDFQLVEAEFQGEKNAIDNCIKMLVAGNMFIKIQDYAIKSIAIKPLESGFNIIF